MSKANKNNPKHSKPYGEKMAQRLAAKRAMRTGGGDQSGQSATVRPDERASMPNPQEKSRLIGPDPQRSNRA